MRFRYLIVSTPIVVHNSKTNYLIHYRNYTDWTGSHFSLFLPNCHYHCFCMITIHRTHFCVLLSTKTAERIDIIHNTSAVYTIFHLRFPLSKKSGISIKIRLIIIAAYCHLTGSGALSHHDSVIFLNVFVIVLSFHKSILTYFRLAVNAVISL